MSIENAPAVAPAVRDPNLSSGTSPGIITAVTSRPNKFARLSGRKTSKPPTTAVVEISSPSQSAPFEFPVRLEKMAQLLEDHAGFGKGKAERWLREKVREDRYRNPDPIPSIKKGKYRFFVVSEVLVWLKKAA